MSTISDEHHVIRRPLWGGGFTLIETLVVMGMVSVLAAVAIPRLEGMDDTRTHVAAHLLLDDVHYARSRAMATGVRHWVNFDTVSDTWSVSAEPLGTKGRQLAQPLPDPVTDLTLTRQLGTGDFAGLSLKKVQFDRGQSVGFDIDGSPLNEREKPCKRDGYALLTSGHRLEVEAISGRISLHSP